MRLWEAPAFLLRFGLQDAQIPPSPLLAAMRLWEAPAFLLRFGLQDAQTPPSPLVGEGGWGDEGQTRTGIQITANDDVPHRSARRDAPADKRYSVARLDGRYSAQGSPASR